MIEPLQIVLLTRYWRLINFEVKGENKCERINGLENGLCYTEQRDVKDLLNEIMDLYNRK